MKGTEGPVTHAWVLARLSGSEALADALGVALGDLEPHLWPDVAPQDAPDTVVVWTVGEGVDVPAIGAHPHLLTALPLTVKVIGRTEDYGTIMDPAAAVYAALHGSHNQPILGSIVLTCTRQGTVQYPEDAAGVQYRHLGHSFRVEVA